MRKFNLTTERLARLRRNQILGLSRAKLAKTAKLRIQIFLGPRAGWSLRATDR